MSYSGGIVSKPVTMTDIAQAVANSSRSLGYLTTNGTIREWAKYKPTDYPTYDVTGKASGSLYWQGADGRCGINVRKYTSFAQLAADNSPYARKTLAVYRMLDYDGYNSACTVIPFTVNIPNNMYVSSGAEFPTSADCNIVSETALHLPIDTLLLNELFPNMYIGIVIAYSNGTYLIKADKTTLSGGTFNIGYDQLRSHIGETIDVYFVVVPNQIPNWTFSYTGEMWSLQATAGYSLKRGVNVLADTSQFAFEARFRDALDRATGTQIRFADRPQYDTTLKRFIGWGAWWNTTPQEKTYTCRSLTVQALNPALTVETTFAGDFSPTTIYDTASWRQQHQGNVEFRSEFCPVPGAVLPASYNYLWNFKSV